MSSSSTAPKETVHAWNTSSLASLYASVDRGLWPDEWHALGASWQHIAGQPVLDIGIGAGRTTNYLLPVAGSYIGIDISAAMLAQAKERFPQADLRLGDARQLEFADNSFSLVMFSFNGIDYIEPTDRPRVLREVHRVLKPGGVFVFSSHNRLVQADTPPPFKAPPVWPTANPLRRLVREMRGRAARERALANYRRLESQQWVRPEIAWINDSAYESAFLTCHITPTEQIRQLREAGFADVDLVLDTLGRRAGLDMRDRFFYVRALRD